MIARSVIEEHAAALVKSPETDPVFLIHLLLLQRHVVSLAVPCREPLRRVRVDDSILVPHPEAKVFDRSESSLVAFIFHLQFIVDLWKEDRVAVETIQVPPGSEVIGRGPKVLHPDEFCHIAQEVID